MSFLTVFFSNDRTRAADLARNDTLLRESIDRYLESWRRKQEVMQRLAAGEPIAGHLGTLQLALADEIAFITTGEDSEKKLIRTLNSFGHKRQSVMANRIFDAMNYASSQEHYVYNLMQRLYNLLRLEAYEVMQIKRKIDRGDMQQAAMLQQSLIENLKTEQQLVTGISKVNLHEFYKSLALGERLKYDMDEREHEIAAELEEEMMQHGGQDGVMEPTTNSAVAALTADCFNRMDELIMELIYDGKIEGHQRVHYEFVNSGLFEDFVRTEIRNRYPQFKDEQFIKIFIVTFRKLFNLMLR